MMREFDIPTFVFFVFIFCIFILYLKIYGPYNTVEVAVGCAAAGPVYFS